MMTTAADEQARLREICECIYRAARDVRILTSINWPLSVKKQFFRHGAQQLPTVNYEPFDSEPCLHYLKKARKLLADSALDDWLSNKIDMTEKSVRLIQSRGRREFFQLSKELYGAPDTLLNDDKSTPLQLAHQFNAILDKVAHVDLGAPPEACILAETLAEAMQEAANGMFGELAPPVSVVQTLSANALAGTQRIRVRRGAHFSDLDVKQLIQHEVYVHVATGLNGLQQTTLKFLGCNSAASTKTQEGLAVFAEMITGCIDLDRMRRLADRVLAIDMAVNGADFIEVYRFFLERTDNPEQSFENARRVFRGGVISGGYPFTKDVVYIDGLLRVHNFLRALVTAGRADCLRLLFCGKLDLEDIPMLGWLSASGLCQPARFLPPWASDLRFLLCYLAYSAFLNQVHFGRIKAHYESMLRDVPMIADSGLAG